MTPDADLPANVVLADLGLHVIGIGYQRTLAPGIALQVDADVIYGPWTVRLLVDGYEGDVRGSVLRVRHVIYPAGSAPDGWWLSPFFQGGPAREPGVAWGWAAAAGASVGYAGRLGPVHLAFGLGGQYHVARIGGSTAPPGFAGLYPHLDGTVGYAF